MFFSKLSNLPLRSLFFDRRTVVCRNAHKSRQTRRSLTRISQEKKEKETTSHSIVPFLSSPKSFTRISLSRVETSWLRFFCLSLSLCVSFCGSESKVPSSGSPSPLGLLRQSGLGAVGGKKIRLIFPGFTRRHRRRRLFLLIRPSSDSFCSVGFFLKRMEGVHEDLQGP